jgi:hypothetical protein
LSHLGSPLSLLDYLVAATRRSHRTASKAFAEKLIVSRRSICRRDRSTALKGAAIFISTIAAKFLV